MFLSTIMAGATDRNPWDDFWFEPLGIATASGVTVSPDSAMRTVAVYGCVRVLAEGLAQLPLLLRRRLSDGGKERAENHPLFEVLHTRPNRWQTSFEWREMMQGHLTLRGNGYSEIIPGSMRGVGELVPLHPDRVKPMWTVDGEIIYEYDDPFEKRKRTLSRQEMFHVRGLSSDGLMGMNPIQMHRESIGMAVAAQDYGARFFQNDARAPGVIEYDGHFKDQKARQQFRERFQEAQTGANRHKTIVLESGMKYNAIGVNNKDAQYLDTRKFQKNDIATIFRVPPHLIGILDRATFSNIEMQSLEFVIFTMTPWFVRWEQAILRDLIVQPGLFAEFLVEGLLRGATKERFEAYKTAIETGWMTRNEARTLENMNPIDGLDTPLQPMNMGPGDGSPSEPDARMSRIVAKTARKFVEAEAAAVQRAGKRYNGKTHEFVSWADRWFSEHAARVADNLELDNASAQSFAWSGRNDAVECDDLDAALETWTDRRCKTLADIALNHDRSNHHDAAQ